MSCVTGGRARFECSRIEAAVSVTPSGSFYLGFVLFSVLAIAALAGIATVRPRWRQDAAALAGVHI
jgi:membrane protein implicated in regulation of membrane protease activity